MFGIFKKKSEIDKLDDQYEKLMKEAHRLSTSDRRASDAKVAEANQVLEEIEKLEKR
jgi:hypothetical protein